MTPLPPKKRSELRAQAHTLSPVVLVGDKGLTDEVLAEVERSLAAHELIKVRAATDDRKARDAWLGTICEKLQAHAVQQIGKVFVVYREKPREEKRAPKREPRAAAKVSDAEDRKVKRVPRSKGAVPRSTSPVPRFKGAPRSRNPLSRSKGAGPRSTSPVPRSRSTATDTDEATRTSRPRSRTPSSRPESAPPKRRPRTSR